MFDRAFAGKIDQRPNAAEWSTELHAVLKGFTQCPRHADHGMLIGQCGFCALDGVIPAKPVRKSNPDRKKKEDLVTNPRLAATISLFALLFLGFSNEIYSAPSLRLVDLVAGRDNSATIEQPIAGIWNGTYYYANNSPAVGCTFSFASAGCSGRSEETNTFGDKRAPKLYANLTCSAATLSPGREITIRKTYDGTGGVSHSVIYQGTVSSDLRTISGQWTINTTGGNFIIWR